MAQTSIHIEPVKGGSEQHNRRHKELDYIRKDLTSRNESHIFSSLPTISETTAKIEADYKAAHGKKLHPKATPIREAVVVIEDSTTLAALQDFCQKCQEKWGITPMQLYTHRDEGHTAEDGTWKPNLHAHIVFCWYNFKTHTTCKLTREDMVDMQTLLADCLQMERGVSSDRKHLNAIQQKNAAELAKLEKLKDQVEKTSKTVVGVQEAADKAIRDCCKQLQHIGQHTVKNFDLLIKPGAVTPTQTEQQNRDRLEEISHRDLTRLKGSELLHEETTLRNLIYHTGLAVERIGRKLQALAKAIPFWKKSRLAHEADLQAAVATAEEKAANSTAEAENARKRAENARNRAEDAEARANARDEQAKETLQNLQARIDEAREEGREAGASAKHQEWQKWYNEQGKPAIDERDRLAEEKKGWQQERRSWLQDFRDIAKILTTRYNPDAVNDFENAGLREKVGSDIWDAAKKPEVKQSTGPHL